MNAPPAPEARGVPERIDALMDRASHRLIETDYFETVEFCERSLRLAVEAADWERFARILLPLQEARRQIRLEAVSEASGSACPVRLVDTPTQCRAEPRAGCVLFAPPLIAADARAFRLRAQRAHVPVLVLTREPMTREGQWPIAAVSARTVRVRLDPPRGVSAAEGTATGDRSEGVVPLAWFEGAAEALGDAGIAGVDRGLHPVHRIEALLECLDALPDHEKLHQRLADAAREASRVPPPAARRRFEDDHPFSF
ncbi:MAG: hypothetical protein AAGB48_10375 [Planctomycetota bacterium]